jgi:4-methyl-5(b-hydroxyethyl)-thiazole monophosphate biosynthesis
MIYLFLQEGFEEAEAITPVDVLRRAGLETATVGESGRIVTGAHGVKVEADLTEADVSLEKADMVVLPGGPGTPNHEKSRKVREALEYCVKHDRYVAAICAAPSVLGHMGLLKGREAVCFPGYESELGAAGVPRRAVCVSGKIITARGPGVSLEFALKLVETLCGPEKAREIGKSMQWNGTSAS